MRVFSEKGMVRLGQLFIQNKDRQNFHFLVYLKESRIQSMLDLLKKVKVF